MNAPNPMSVDDYIDSKPEAARPVLERMRRTIRKALPGAEETMSYRMPAYKLHGGCVLYFAGWKQHWSLYPATGSVQAEFKHELAPYKVEKGTIRFPLTLPPPADLIGRIAKFRAKEVAERGK